MTARANTIVAPQKKSYSSTTGASSSGASAATAFASAALLAAAAGSGCGSACVGAASADGATLFALVVDADGGLAASAVDVATQTERLRVRVLDKGLIAVDIAECAAEG